MRHTPTHQHPDRPDRRGFTLIEVLVVIGLIVVLATILLVALAASTETAGVAKTRTLMSSMSQATSQFRRDHNILPPVLDFDRAMSLTPPQDIDELQDWFSFTSPADYLLGYGGGGQDGKDGLGIRSPGIDGVWGASTDQNGNGFADLGERNPGTAGEGQVYGPYLKLTDDNLLAKINGVDPDGHPILVRPNDSGYTTLNAPLVVLDYFGRPIQYYRRHPWAKRTDIPQNLRFNLGDVFVLRPFDLKSGSEAQGAQDATGDTFTTFGLKSAQFAFFSHGPDLEDNHELRFDDPDDSNNSEGTEFVNADNIVEVGK